MSRKSENRSRLEARIGHVFERASLLDAALTHVSALKSSEARTRSYQRLEFLGDHVLGLVISDLLYRAYPDAEEGELSKRLADLVRKETCAEIAADLGLQDMVQIGAVGGAAGVRLRKSVLGDVCEALIGAVDLDKGFDAAFALIERLWSDRLLKPNNALRDAKTVLQEWAQGRGLAAPTYREVTRSGPDHAPRFVVAVHVEGLESAQGEGTSKRAAEKAAAALMLAREGVSADV